MYVTLFAISAICFTVSVQSYAMGKVSVSQTSTAEDQRVTFSEQDADEAEKYWTEERMQRAQPVDLILSPDDHNHNFSSLDVESPEEDPGKFQLLYNRGTYVDVNKWPYKVAGRLFFIINGRNGVCSAQFVGNNHTLITAAHCLCSQGHKSHHIVFYQRRNGKGTGRVVHISEAVWPQRWKNGFRNSTKEFLQIAPYDYGKLTTVSRSDVGHLGFKEFSGKSMHIAAIGYSSKHSRNKMYQDKGYAKRSPFKGVLYERPNEMKKGASGGAWINMLSHSQSDPDQNQLISVNSFIDSNQNIIYGPEIKWKDIKDWFKS